MALAPFSVAAAPVLRSGESVTVTDAQEVQNDFYAVGGTVTVSGKISGDFYAAGGTVTVNGEITQDAVVAGGSAHITGKVGDDVRVIAGDLTIGDTVGGDILVMGGIVHILSTAQIKGDIFFLGGEIDMDGDLRGSLSGRGGTIRINGPVLGNVSVTSAQAVELGDQAHVQGTVAYSSMNDIARAPGSVVVGDITKTELVANAASPLSSILPLLALFFTTLVYLLLCKKKLQCLMEHTVESFGYRGLVGFGVVLLMPIVAIVLLVSVIGLVVGTTLLLLYFVLLIVASSLTGIFAGALLSRYFEGKTEVTLKWSLLGTLTLALILYIPYLGLLLVGVGDLIVIGGIANLVYARMRR
jgi:cytoskeletal protein CcmA (bactofilin family)